MTDADFAQVEAFAFSVVCERNRDDCGPFADWLDDHGLHRDARLLRARWLRWKRERALYDWFPAGVSRAEITPMSSFWRTLQLRKDALLSEYVRRLVNRLRRLLVLSA